MSPTAAADKSLGDTKTGRGLLSDVYCRSPSKAHVHQSSETKDLEQGRNVNTDYCFKLVEVIMIPRVGNESIA